MKCKYYDCGWCYAPDTKEHNSNAGQCQKPDKCVEFARQYDGRKIEIIEDNEKVLRQTIKEQQEIIKSLRNKLKRIRELTK